MLEIERIAVSYGEVTAVRDVSLTIKQGEIVTLIGGNGAGKTTTLKTISGLLTPSAGSIRFEGRSITGLAPDRIVALGVAHVPEGRHVFPKLSVEDNLRVGAYLVREPVLLRKSLDQVYAMFPQLTERRRQMGETLSGGEQQMLAIGRAIMSRPRLMLLDEPSLGLAPRVVEEVAKAIIAFRRSGMTILLVEQNARVALALSERGYVIETGRIVLSDSATGLKRNPMIIESYLGGRGKDAPAPAAKPISSAPTREAVSCKTAKPFQPSFTAPKSSASLAASARTAGPSRRTATPPPTSTIGFFAFFRTSAKECLPAARSLSESVPAPR